MIFSRRNRGGFSINYGSFLPAVLLLFLGATFSIAHAEPPYKIEVRLTEESSLQLLDNQGKVWQTLPMGSVRKRITIQNIPLLASFGKDSQHRSIIMLGLDMSVNEPVSFLFENNIIVASPEAILTLQLSPDHSSAEISPSLMGKVWINGNLLSRGETKSLQFHSAKKPGSEIVPSPDQPRPSVRDFQSIPTPSI